MRALICRAWAGVETLEIGEMPAPAPGKGEILIDIVASSANFADTIMVGGNYQTKPDFPFAPGLEGAGRVAAVGAGVGTGAAVAVGASTVITSGGGSVGAGAVAATTRGAANRPPA